MKKSPACLQRTRPQRIALYAIFGIIVALLLYGIWIEPFMIQVRHLWIRDSKIWKALKGKTAIHISDLHIKKIGKREKKLLKLIEQIKPDMIFLTGDYVTWDGDYQPALNFLAKLQAKNGVWAVMGDYDYSNSRKSCLFCHEPTSGRPKKQHQIEFIRNTARPVRLPEGEIWIAGIDREAEAEVEFNYQLPFLQDKDPAIILSHDPLVFGHLDNKKEAFILTGDTHGGQIPLPSWFWSLLGYEKNANYNQGYFRDGRKQMYVSRGLGTSHVPVRILRRPELVVLHF